MHNPHLSRETPGRRITKACARCRKRKIKCDFQYPTCGNCASVKAECLGFDAAKGKARPRSTISHLENEIAQLEIELARLKSKQSGDISLAFSATVDDLTTKLARTIAEPQIGNHHDASRFDRVADILPLASPTFLSQSPLPKFSGNGLPSADDDVSENGYQSTNIASIPRNVIDIMLKNYCETYLPQYPAIEEETLYESCNRIYLNDQPNHWDFFTIAITLAISANTLIRHDEKRAIAAAGEFWATAKNHLPYVGLGNNWQRLQALQLLAHYGLLNPKLVNCSNCAAAATRLCTQLGLHRELTGADQDRLGAKVANTRRQLFWTSYSLDAAFHSVLCQPYIWPKGAITIGFPNSENTISPTSHVWALRQIEAEVTIKMYFPTISITSFPPPAPPSSSPSDHHYQRSPPLSLPASPSPTFQTWFHTTEHRLQEWSTKSPKSGLADVLDLQTFRLNRPSPAIPHPTASMRKNAISAAITLTKEYAQMERSGKFFYIWYAAHYLTELWVSFVESVVMGLEEEALLISRAGGDVTVTNNNDGNSNGNGEVESTTTTFLTAFDTTLLTSTLRTFPLLLRKVAHRWPAIQPQAWALEEISTPVLQKLAEYPLREAAALIDYATIRQRLALFSSVPGQLVGGGNSGEESPMDSRNLSRTQSVGDVAMGNTTLTSSLPPQQQQQQQQMYTEHVYPTSAGIHQNTQDQQGQQQLYPLTHFPASTSTQLFAPAFGPEVASYILPDNNANFPPLAPPPAPPAFNPNINHNSNLDPDPSWSPSQQQNTTAGIYTDTSTPYIHSDTAIATGAGAGPGEEMFWDLAGLDLDQIFAALLEGRDVSVLPEG